MPKMQRSHHVRSSRSMIGGAENRVHPAARVWPIAGQKNSSGCRSRRTCPSNNKRRSSTKHLKRNNSENKQTAAASAPLAKQTRQTWLDGGWRSKKMCLSSSRWRNSTKHLKRSNGESSKNRRTYLLSSRWPSRCVVLECALVTKGGRDYPGGREDMDPFAGGNLLSCPTTAAEECRWEMAMQ